MSVEQVVGGSKQRRAIGSCVCLPETGGRTAALDTPFLMPLCTRTRVPGPNNRNTAI